MTLATSRPIPWFAVTTTTFPFRHPLASCSTHSKFVSWPAPPSVHALMVANTPAAAPLIPAPRRSSVIMLMRMPR
eukprot:CAMPEP_0177729892 /NCGR_PEP_ID=MMETSP0484_2-20121128/21687_1 /TAXON_ID=354590 /ORGANISM="Rhodomonas lens, Strain RHODO" /LENGTH=74 /DNA_ID=CAMNT_0019242823 /DNA_START=289 /DNA_END=513 /DNA_ORIENTATION=-